MYFCQILILVLINLNRNAFSEPAETRNQRIIPREKVASPEDWPFMAVVSCGRKVLRFGALIRPKWVLTAGIGLDGETIKEHENMYGKMNVRLGTLDMSFEPLGNPNKTTLVTGVNDSVIGVEKVILHDNYLGKGPVDINYSALIKLLTIDPTARPVSFARHVFFNECKIEQMECKSAAWSLHGRFKKRKSKLLETSKLEVCNAVKPEVCKCSNEKNQKLIEYLKDLDVNSASEVQKYGQDKLLVITEHSEFRRTGSPLICTNLGTKEKTLHGIFIAEYVEDHIAKENTTTVEATATAAKATTTIHGNTGKNIIVAKIKIKNGSFCEKNNLTLTLCLIFIKILLNF